MCNEYFYYLIQALAAENCICQLDHLLHFPKLYSLVTFTGSASVYHYSSHGVWSMRMYFTSANNFFLSLVASCTPLYYILWFCLVLVPIWHDLKHKCLGAIPPLFVLSSCIFYINSLLQNNAGRQQGRKKKKSRGREKKIQIFTLCRQYYVFRLSCLPSKKCCLLLHLWVIKEWWEHCFRARTLFDEMQLFFKVLR